MPKPLQEKSIHTSPEITAAYAALSSDFNPLHVDAVFAAGTPFGNPIAHGAMALDLLLNAIEDSLGTATAAEMDVRFTAPVKVGERITAGGLWNGGGYDVWVRKDDGTEVVKGTYKEVADA